ncbi:hypothetical protein M432DRAFT_115552 [Thermoascus aurantiacus ATCC 26904]
MLPASVARGLATTAATAAASSVAVRRWSSLLLSRPAASKFPIPRKSNLFSSIDITPSPFSLPSRRRPFSSTSANPQRHPQTIEEKETPSLNATSDGSGEPAPYYSPYQPKRQWPPDMSKLSPKHQFRLERKYRRRAALKYARPKWSKGTKLVQWGIIGFVLIYAVFFMEWDTNDNPFEEIRKEFFSGVNSLFSSPQPPIPTAPIPSQRVDDSKARN